MEVTVGVRVVRGPHWSWRDQDGGEGNVGTVAEIQIQEAQGGEEGRAPAKDQATPTPCVVTVQWDCGNRCRYRCGLGGKYDLRVFDSGPAGTVHPGQVCNGCGLDPITGMRWKCVRCHEYNICTECYMTGKHVLEHDFDRFDTPRMRARVPARGHCKKKEVSGIFKFAEVVPWCDWHPQEGTDGAEKGGEVVRLCGKTIDDNNTRGFAEVQWKETEMRTIHMVGSEGKVELKCTDPSSGGYFYPEHLPVLGAPLPPMDPAAISTGDLVRVELEPEVFQAMQEGHGGWSEIMLEVIGKIGTVVAISDSGDLKIRYPDHHIWTLCPEAVVKVDIPQFQVGDLVRISSDLAKVQSLQSGHGEWNESVVLMLGEVGRVGTVFSGGDVMVIHKGKSWVFNPLCLSPAEDAQEKTDDTFAEWAKKDAKESMKIGLQTMLRQGQLSTIMMATTLCEPDVLRKYLKKYPDQVDSLFNDRTALHLAASAGIVEPMKVLLEFNADLELQDNTSNRALHMSAYNGCEETTQLLVDAGADVNSKTLDGSTPLMAAAIRGNVRSLKVLLKQPIVDISAQDADGNTALHCAVLYQRTACVLPLLEAGADPMLLNFNLMTCLHIAARMGYLPIVEILLHRFPECINAKDGYGYTILHCAAVQDQLSIITLAMEEGKCDIEITNESGQTALHVALARGNTKIVEKLVSYGANVNPVDNDGCSPLHYILNREAMEAPSDESPQIQKLHKALFGKTVEDNLHPLYTTFAVAAFLLRKGADIHLKSKSGHSPYQCMPFIATLMTLLADYDDIIEQGGHADGSPMLSLSNTSGKTYTSGSTTRRKGHGSNTFAYRENTGESSSDYYGHPQTFMIYSPASSSSGSYSKGKGSGASASASASPQTGSSLYVDYGSSDYGYGYDDGGYYMYGGDQYFEQGAKTTQQSKKSSSAATGASNSSGQPKPPVSSAAAASSSPSSSLSSSAKPSNSSATPAFTDTGSQDDELCFLCDNPVNVKFFPCGHAAMCQECAPKAKRCPVCKVSVKGTYDKICVNCHKQEATIRQNCGHGVCNSCEKQSVCAGCQDLS